VLNWETVSENNSSHFSVERSADGYTFQTIGNVPAAGNSSDIRHYSFADDNAAYINHYRLKQVDIDGRFTYSKLLYVKMQQQNPVSIISNPVKNILQLNIKEAAGGIVTIYDFIGEKLKSFSVTANGYFSIDISSIAAAKYLLIFSEKNGDSFSQFFIKAQ
jgi:hypothetical protein